MKSLIQQYARVPSVDLGATSTIAKRLKSVLANSMFSAIVVSLSGCSSGSSNERSTATLQELAPTTAHWIWASATKANQWVAFRKTLSVAAKPTTALTQIATDTKYWLYVNGKLVTFEGGLKRGPNPNDTYYDETDIASYLTSGTNTIAVLVWHHGKSGYSHKDSGAGGLLFQSDVVVNGATTRVNSDTSWKVTPHAGYGENSSGTQANYRLSESNVYYDARNAASMSNWNQPTFNASSWASATDKGIAGSAPWNALVKRPIPAFRYTDLLDYRNTAPATGQGSTPIVMKLPSNLQVTPYLKVTAPAAGAVIGMQTDHYTDGGDSNVRSTYIAVQGTQEFESLGWMSGTTVEYTIPSNVQIVALKYRESGYGTKETGGFTSEDVFFNTLWGKASATLGLNMRDNFSDCPTRERAQWWGDVVNEQKQTFYVFDTRAHALSKKAIGELMEWQASDNSLHSPVPGINTDELPLQMLASVYSLWTYYTYTGDADTVKAAYSHIRSYMYLWSLGTDGLVVDRAGDWPWADWGDNIDSALLRNAWYYLALDTTIKLANLTGNGADVGEWQYRSNSISANFNRIFWDSARGEYRSPGYLGDTDDRGNALAVVAGLNTPSQRGALTEVLRIHQNASPYMELYVLQALYMLGNPAGAEARMKARYAAQVNDPGYTLWEYWDKGSGTDNHAWSGGPLFVLSAYAGGVRPTSPGYATYLVRPQLGTILTHITTVPTVKGNIVVNLTRHDMATHFTATLTSPSGTIGTVAIPRQGMVNPLITANGTTVYSNETPQTGISGLTYAGRDYDYVYFTVSPGNWNFDETGAVPTYCANENGTCSFTGTKLVRFGANGQYLYRIVNADVSGGVACNSASFGGDPIWGTTKQCHYSAPIPSGGPPGYTLCAQENGTCSFSGKANVAYGSYGAFNSRSYSGSVTCNNANFGDPIYGVQKSCYYAAEPTNQGWSFCATETGICSFSGSRMVAYGANGAYQYSWATGNISCNSTAFGGDPIQGTAKFCYYRQ